MSAASPAAPRAGGALPRLAVVSPISPWPVLDGFALRVAALLEELRSDWDITLFAPEGASPEWLVAREELVIPPAAAFEHREFLRSAGPQTRERLDAMGADAWLLFGTAGAVLLGGATPAIPHVLDLCDSATLTHWRSVRTARSWQDRLRALRETLVAASIESRLRAAARFLSVVGPADAAALERLPGDGTVLLVPNGVQVGQPASPSTRSAAPTVVFTGVMAYGPNVDAVVHFVRHCWPLVRAQRRDAQFRVVGRMPVPEVQALAGVPGVTVVGAVDDVQDELRRAWLAVAPMQSGAGVKNKILEAWAVGTPVVMSPVADNGLEAMPAELRVVGTTPAEMASKVVHLLDDRTTAESAGASARSIVERDLSWRVGATRLHAALRANADDASPR